MDADEPIRPDTAFVKHAAATLHRAQEDGRLPQVSSPVSAMIGALGGDANAPAEDYANALVLVARAYGEVLHRASLGPVSNVLSLCTGYDAATELLALEHAGVQPSVYASIDRDPAAAELNRACCTPLRVETRFVGADLAGPETDALLATHDFELCLAFRPPIFRTRCGDNRRLGGGGLFPTPPDASVAEALVSVVERTPAMRLLVVTRDAVELDAFAQVCKRRLSRGPRRIATVEDPRLPLHAGLVERGGAQDT